LLIYSFWASFGSGIILYVATFSRIPQTLVEAGRLDGMSFWGEIIHVVFPLTWPLFSTQLLLQFCGFLNASGPILLFTKGKFGTYTLSYWIFEQTQGGIGLTKGAALGLVMTLVSLPVVLIFKSLAEKVEPIEY
jgi:ABC-type sugar transport system permease subunit